MNSNVGQDLSKVNGTTDLNRGPCLVAGQLWKREDLINQMGISPKTLTRWKQNGLIGLRAFTKEEFYYSDDVIAFMRTITVSKANQEVAR